MSSSSEIDQVRRIIAAFLRGDTEQYRIIKRQISRLVDRWYAADPADREDLVADTLKILYESLASGRFRGQSIKSLNSYVYGMTRFRVIRTAARAKSGAQPHDPEHLDQMAGDIRDDAHDRYAHRQLISKIYSALNQTCRELLGLKFSLGWSDQEIAEHRKMTKNAVSTAISRCIRRAQTLDFVREILYQQTPDKHYEG